MVSITGIYVGRLQSRICHGPLKRPDIERSTQLGVSLNGELQSCASLVPVTALPVQICRRYESDETPMVEYLGLHNALNARRVVAQQGDFTKGPRVLVSPHVHATCLSHQGAIVEF